MGTECGYAGKLLWVDLSSGAHHAEPTSGFVPMCLGGRGLAAKIAWDHLKSCPAEFDEENVLIFMTGPLGGTPAPAAGRGYVFGVAPQAYPPRYTRSGFGGKWASTLKYAGFDGLIIKGKAESPSVLFISDDRVTIIDGRKYWGLDAIEVQKALGADFGLDIACMVIGQAGENRVRIATIQSGLNNAAGQGGFGAVMGSKNLKAVVIRGTGGIAIAHLDRLLELRDTCVRLLGQEQARPPRVETITTYTSLEWNAGRLMEDGDLGQVSMAYSSCTACPLHCLAGGVPTQRYLKNVPGVSHPARLSGAVKCVELGIMGWGSVAQRELERIRVKTGRDHRFNPGFRAGFELVNLADRYGVNAWEFQAIMVWLTECGMEGIDLESLLGMPFEPDGPLFWQTLLRQIAFRQGAGAVLAEGIARSAVELGEGFRRLSPHAAHGFAHHGFGTYNWSFFPFPYWIPIVLMWSTDTRDPMSDTGHKFCMDLALNPEEAEADRIAANFYRAKNTLAPRPARIPDGVISHDLLDIAYSDKEMVTIRHQNRAMATGSLILCDGAFPLLFSPANPDRSGDTAMEGKLFEAVTGIDMDEQALDRSGEALFNLERAISFREGRRIEGDLSIVAALEGKGDWSRGIALDPERYRKLLQRYYRQRGWDPESGCPPAERLLASGLVTEAGELEFLMGSWGLKR